MSKISTRTVKDFGFWLSQNGLKRGYIINLDNKIHLSSPLLKTFSEEITSSSDYQNHEGIFFEYQKETESLFVAVVHRTVRGAGQGGTRFRQYPTVANLLTDAMRLSKGMTDKNSLAKINWGGGKSIIHSEHNPKTVSKSIREKIFIGFGQFIASLNGLYVCAEDMNVSPEDLGLVHSVNRYTNCIPKSMGGSSNPSFLTARGVFSGIVAGLQFMDGANDTKNINLSGKHILVQGAGNVGFNVIKHIIDHGGKVSVFEPYQPAVEKLIGTFENINVIQNADDIYDIEADIFSPNAIGAILNDDTIPRLKVKMVAGGANNQLKDPIRHAKMLHDRGIDYVPDFLINRMGIVNCCDEQYGYLPEAIEERLSEIHPEVIELLQLSKSENKSPQFKALELATELSLIPHPIHGHRGAKILKFLMENEESVWFKNNLEFEPAV